MVVSVDPAEVKDYQSSLSVKVLVLAGHLEVEQVDQVRVLTQDR